ncbi:oxygen-dependent coproporphyrinogen oxidase [Francisella tularensis subsp. novicida]|uniref:Oxygen-dependent coproporphyrinogen-III oxidase n=2 Tax=Francisella tularensis TaxID=263 RepID=HEM6_FRATN|nr:oxygen-dependent coproporphyrinogen oxidase [Francisella tularensis]A0Q6H6.1 RecName: Full=Oxygen-dependent coproporphyrinogen-III oxidase; Short=CPO; Short=Coprogen oxidase; Short=Coproporphyrinogenase [Francisella tularensis subsp. novicida U112]ABK89841.1 coproporphyrinogen III oxidase [Francisella tularensis subsp. novicida U112]AJI60639.1 coproporphyrinogen III oxidase family protein [Francisella tularensis subsp. novicida U112]EDX27429.1 coproporphyrinogen III oxidase, aerobic [Francis
MQEKISKFEDFLTQLQQNITTALEQHETNAAKFISDKWQKPDTPDQKLKGYGNSMIIEGGEIFEKGVVAFSRVHGSELPPSATAKRQELAGKSFIATGLSLVIHPRNPFVPTSHANFRIFIAGADTDTPIWWFGGGFDLTPYYPFEEDAIHWHQTAKNICDKHDKTYYSKFKKWCDEYFYLKHRDECRGVGGLFFDDLNDKSFDECFNFVTDCANSYLDAYIPIVAQRKNIEYSQKHKDFQLYRRGRYVEFNLVFDRGTIFGLQSGGRTESILSSMPPMASWRYNWQPEQNSEEAKVYQYIKPRDWIK